MRCSREYRTRGGPRSATMKSCQSRTASQFLTQRGASRWWAKSRRCGTLDAGVCDYNRNTCVSWNVTGKDISYAVGVLCRVLRGCPNWISSVWLRPSRTDLSQGGVVDWNRNSSGWSNNIHGRVERNNIWERTTEDGTIHLEHCVMRHGSRWRKREHLICIANMPRTSLRMAMLCRRFLVV